MANGSETSTLSSLVMACLPSGHIVFLLASQSRCLTNRDEQLGSSHLLRHCLLAKGESPAQTRRLSPLSTSSSCSSTDGPLTQMQEGAGFLYFYPAVSVLCNTCACRAATDSELCFHSRARAACVWTGRRQSNCSRRSI